MPPFLVASLIFHLLFATGLTLYLSVVVRPEPEIGQDVDVVFLTESQLTPPARRKPLVRPLRRASDGTRAPAREQARSPLPQVILQSDQPTVDVAMPEMLELSADVMSVPTAARLAEGRSVLAPMRGTAQKPTPGKGLLTGVQRPQGQLGGRSAVDSAGAADVGLPGGKGRGDRGKGRGTGSGGVFGDALARIGESIARGTITGKADVLFVLDTSGSMGDNIAAVADHLFEMTDTLEAQDVEYRLGIVEFRELGTGVRVEMSGWSSSAEMLRRRMRELGVVGNERALDALVQTLELTRFREDADRHLVFVTDEPVTTKWDAEGAAEELEQRILTRAAGERIHVQVLGYPEAFQRDFALRTGGTFQRIPSDKARTRPSTRAEGLSLLPRTALDGAFRLIAGDVGRWARPDPAASERPVDLWLFLDFSASMQGRLRAVMNGISALSKSFDIFGVDEAMTVIRFAVNSGVTGSGVSGIDVSPAFSEVDRVQALLQYPAVGDERLVDAIVAGIDRVRRRRRRGVPQVGIIITDELPTFKDATVEEMSNAMADSGIRFYAIAPDPPAGLGKYPTLRALYKAVKASGGKTYPMPEAHLKAFAGR